MTRSLTVLLLIACGASSPDTEPVDETNAAQHEDPIAEPETTQPSAEPARLKA